MGLKSIKVAKLSSSSLEEEFVFFLVETPDTQERRCCGCPPVPPR
jgi:hypothetical protein